MCQVITYDETFLLEKPTAAQDDMTWLDDECAMRAMIIAFFLHFEEKKLPMVMID